MSRSGRPPRLPLMAFVPVVGGRGDRDDLVDRFDPAFLAVLVDLRIIGDTGVYLGWQHDRQVRGAAWP